MNIARTFHPLGEWALRGPISTRPVGLSRAFPWCRAQAALRQQWARGWRWRCARWLCACVCGCARCCRRRAAGTRLTGGSNTNTASRVPIWAGTGASPSGFTRGVSAGAGRKEGGGLTVTLHTLTLSESHTLTAQLDWSMTWASLISSLSTGCKS